MYSEIDLEFLQVILRTLMATSILVFLVWTENWKLLLALSIVFVSFGFFGLNTIMELETIVIISEEASVNILLVTIGNFLKAIFVLLLAIFTWLRKELISIKL